MQATTTRSKIMATADGAGVVSHAGARLLADLADATTLTGELSAALDGVRGPRPRHDPGTGVGRSRRRDRRRRRDDQRHCGAG